MPIERPLAARMRMLVAAAAGIGALPAFADGADTVNYSAGVTHQHDNNLFRLPGGVTPLPLTGKTARADDIATSSLGISLKKTYSLQQIEAGYEHVSNRYSTYSYLDNEADNARAAWRWQFTPRLKGNLSFNRSQTLVSFGDYTDYGTRNIRTSTMLRFDADWNVLPGGWHLLAGVDRSRFSNSQLFTQDEGSRSASADFGVRYVFPSNNWIGFVTRSGAGEFIGRRLDGLHQLDTGFRDRRHEIRAYWMHGKTTLEGAFGYATRDYDHYASRDYGGGVGNIKWTWLPTGKLALVASWKRDLVAYTDATSSYYQQDVYSIMPVWQVEAKLKVSLKLDHVGRDYRGPVVALPSGVRNDRSNSAQLSAEWTPLRAVTVSGYFVEDARRSSLAGSGYDDRIVGVSVQLNF